MYYDMLLVTYDQSMATFDQSMVTYDQSVNGHIQPATTRNLYPPLWVGLILYKR